LNLLFATKFKFTSLHYKKFKDRGLDIATSYHIREGVLFAVGEKGTERKRGAASSSSSPHPSTVQSRVSVTNALRACQCQLWTAYLANMLPTQRRILGVLLMAGSACMFFDHRHDSATRQKEKHLNSATINRNNKSNKETELRSPTLLQYLELFLFVLRTY
jgi:hypothetical protein